MRATVLALAALLASTTVAVAAPPTVTVSIGPKLQHEFEKNYGVREIPGLSDQLKVSVERALARTGAHADARIELVITDVRPNRPTFQQMLDTPGLSMQSFGVGGAAIEGRIVGADGTEQPIDYSWYESDIRQSYANWVWHDAEWTFDRFARRLARGQEVARR